jgi:uncharacterized protein YbjT (DUF2867 family)
MTRKKIALVGATGMLGQPVTHALIRTGYPVRLLVRDSPKAQGLFGNSPEYVVGDLRDLQVLDTFLRGQDVLYLNLSVDPTSRVNDFQAEREGLENVLLAVKKAGIKRVIYLSSLVQFHRAPSWWVWDIKRAALLQIMNADIPYTIFYPSTFMESFVKGAYRQGNFITLAGHSRVPMHLIAGEDYARQVLRSIEIDTESKAYYVQGKECFTADEAAGIVAKNYSKTALKIVKMPIGILRCLGYFLPKMNYGYHMLSALNSYPEEFVAADTWQRLGEPEISFVEYLQKA